MKNWLWGTLVALGTFLIITVFRPPTWILLLIVFPLLAVGFTMISFTYSFRSGLSVEPVPARGYENRVNELKRAAPEMERLDFSMADMFFIKTIPDCIVYGFIHRKEPAYFCLYHFGTKVTVDIVSLYSQGISLTTSNTADSGNIPRPAKKALQIFPGFRYADLWEGHRRAMSSLAGCGLSVQNLTAGELRSLLLTSIKEFKEYVRQQSFWPVKLIYWVVTRYGKRYCRPLETQWQGGTPANIFISRDR